MDMKVMMSGNLGGVAYTYAKYLCRRNIDISLYLWNWELNKDTRNPLKTDIECKVLPDWVQTFSDTRFIFGEFHKRAKNFDIAHAFNIDPIWAQFTGKPFISHPVGSDAREYAFSKGFHPALLRRAYRTNDVFFFGSHDYYNNVLKMEKIRNPVHLDGIQPVDFNPQKGCQVSEREGIDELFFHPSSHIEKVKGNLTLIKAYAKYVKEYNPCAKLIMIEWGEDIEKSKNLVNELKITDKVIFKKWLSKQDIFNYMGCSDIIFDQFILPSSSTIQREANAIGKPVVKFMDDNWFKVYAEMPFVSAGTLDELYRVFVDYHREPEKFRAIGRSGKSFVAKYYNPKYITDKIILEYERITVQMPRTLSPSGLR